MNIFSSQNIKFFLPPERNSLNDATQYYIELIEKAIEKAGGSSIRCNSLSEINSKDTVFTIELNTFMQCFFKRRGVKIIHWVQGVSPEEAMLTNPNKLFYYLRNMIEFLIMKFAKKIFFVSKAMLEHYERKYKIKVEDKAIIIPCYNKHLQKETFFIPNRYTKPSFVYAGSLSTWQCFDEMLSIYKKLEENLSNCKLTILTAEIEKANTALAEKQIQHFEVKYIPLKELELELSKYKYGFLIRKTNVINYVATPTKMNSYLSVGLIPIFTDAVADFNEKIDLKEYEIKLLGNINTDKAIQEILTFEKNININPVNYYNIINKIFIDYYNDEKYINLIE
ncbi:glycosyltransferase family protein [Capnocytophaga granulosa]|uniref:hypothetical protein n=1 Tax=Capnocytophaga granulosa TaxID=45242 RepID=UPI0038574463